MRSRENSNSTERNKQSVFRDKSKNNNDYGVKIK